MTKSGNSFKDRLKALQEEYRQLLPMKIQEIESTWVNSWKHPQRHEEMLDELYRQSHSLAGSGTTFGYSEISACAAELEAFVKSLLDYKSFSRVHDQTMTSFVQRLRSQLTPDSAPAQGPQTPTDGAHRSQRVRHPVIYWYGAGPTAKEICGQLGVFGFQGRQFTEMTALRNAAESKEPDILVYDLSEAKAGPDPAVFTALSGLSSNPRIICILHSHDGVQERLTAIRGGAAYCFNKPVYLDDFLEALDALAPARAEKPYSLLIVDDDTVLAKNSALILEKAGMQVAIAESSFQALEMLRTQDPDLMLVDLHMPECNGVELTRLVRQDPYFKDLLIVYLSQEQELASRLEALEAGAEDFILKPVKYKYLYHSLACRIKRARERRGVRLYDPLTNVLHHTAFYKELTRRVARGAKAGDNFVVALLSLENFKDINEVYGHDIGDRVLRTLSLMLRRGFGEKVVLARYGGDMFALILPASVEERAREILNRLRQDFGRVKHRGYSGSFSVSLSCGLASFPQIAGVAELIEKAEQDLQKAKAEAVDLCREKVSPTSGEAEPGIVEGDGGTVLEDFADAGADSGIYILDEDAVLVEEDEDLVFDDDADTPEAAASRLAANGRSIVVVDDDRQVLNVISSFLESEGFQVYCAGTGDEGYQLARQHKPDIVLLDLLLFPGIHGFELCKLIKEDPELADVRTILMTAVYKDYRYRMEGKEAGGDAFIIKPINFDELLRIVDELVPVA